MVVSRIIDTGLVLAGVYLALSLVVSHVNEQISAFLHWRGNTLYSGVLNLLSGSASLVETLFQHPLIASAQCDSDGKIQASEKYRPSYIGARDFSLALWQAVATANEVEQNGKSLIVYALADAPTAPVTFLGTLQSQIAKLPESGLRLSLYSLLGQAQGDYEKLLQVTDAWFDRQMDRVAGWYRRKTQYVVVVIALLLVAILGVDSIRIVTRLYADDGLRATISQSIGKTVTSAPAGAPLLSDQQQVNLLAALDDPSFVKAFISGPIIYGFSWVHLLGVAITIIALSLGAPFWFDALQFFTNCRLAGPKPQTPANASAPAQTTS
jgi:hypothetical protein